MKDSIERDTDDYLDQREEEERRAKYHCSVCGKRLMELRINELVERSEAGEFIEKWCCRLCAKGE